MNHDTVARNHKGSGRSLAASLLLALPMLLLSILLLSRGQIPAGNAQLFAFSATLLFLNAAFFMMIHTGLTDRYRALVFVMFALAFIISFTTNLIETRGSVALSEADMLAGDTPFCHIVIPMVLIPAALTKTIIFPGSITGAHASVSAMFVLWIGASLAIGRGFCSWVCFFGGLDEGFSRIPGRTIVKNIPAFWKYLPWGILVAVVLTSAATLSPTYCSWLCPFKATTEHVQITSFKTLLQTVIFMAIFLAFVVVLPYLTKKRTQCGLFCPFGAFQSLTNRINPFDIRIDGAKCVQCGKCEAACPTFSLGDEALAAGKSGLTCCRCGKCVDVCHKGAISFHVKGTRVASVSRETARILFLYPAFLFMAAIGGSMIRDAILRLWQLVTTGSMV